MKGIKKKKSFGKAIYYHSYGSPSAHLDLD